MWHIKNVVVKSTFVWGFRKELRFIETRLHFNQVLQEARGRSSGNRMRNDLGDGLVVDFDHSLMLSSPG